MLLQALKRGDDPQHAAVVAVIKQLDADVLLLTGIDYDLNNAALDALAARLATAGAPYPYRFAMRPNTGVATGLDLDGNGKTGEPRDGQGYGRFAGEGGMAILSRMPIALELSRDFSGFLWKDLPESLIPPATDAAVRAVQRLSSTGHWDVPLRLPTGKTLRLLAWLGSPSVFDGPEDRNGRRNHDETAFWLHLLNGKLPEPPPQPPFVLLGQSSMDPADGEGLPDAIRALLAHPALQDPAPRSTNPHRDSGQNGDPALDTVVYDGVGGLRVDLVLPSADLQTTGSGVLWPPDTDAFAPTLAAGSRHRPVWVDIAMP
jgi:hypothetical protein